MDDTVLKLERAAAPSKRGEKWTTTAPLVRCLNRYGDVIWMSPDMARQAAARGAVALMDEAEEKSE